MGVDGYSSQLEQFFPTSSAESVAALNKETNTEMQKIGFKYWKKSKNLKSVTSLMT